MSLDSFKRRPEEDNFPRFDANRESFDAGTDGGKYDFDALGRQWAGVRERLGRDELADALRDLTASGEIGTCIRAGDWYVESVEGGVCLSPYSAGTGPDRPKSFVAHDRLNVALADLAVPSVVSDALPQGVSERPKAQEDRVSMLAKLLQDHPSSERFYSFGDLVSPSRAEVRRIVGQGNLLWIHEHSRSELVREVGTDARYTPESAKKRISKEVARLDAQIDQAGERDARTLQNLLIDVRQNLAGNAPTDFSLQTGEALRNMAITVDRMLAPGYEAGVGDTWDLARDSFHLLRGSISTSSGQVLSEFKDLTSRRLFELGPKEAPVEHFIRESISGDAASPDMISRGLVAWMKNTPASMAGIIDGTLDTTQSGVDLAVAPDKVLENVKGFVGGLSLDFVKTLASEMASEAEMADFVYCAAYVLTVFVAGWRLGPKI